MGSEQIKIGLAEQQAGVSLDQKSKGKRYGSVLRHVSFPGKRPRTGVQELPRKKMGDMFP